MSAPEFPALEDFLAGFEMPSLTYEVTQDFIERYGAASLDLNPVHMNPDWCARAQVFGMPQTVQHGMMTMSFMASLVLRGLGPLAEIRSVDSKFTKPVPVGSVITCHGVVSDVHVLGNGNDYVTVTITTVDATGDTVAVGDVDVRIPPGPRPVRERS